MKKIVRHGIEIYRLQNAVYMTRLLSDNSPAMLKYSITTDSRTTDSCSVKVMVDFILTELGTEDEEEVDEHDDACAGDEESRLIFSHTGNIAPTELHICIPAKTLPFHVSPPPINSE